MESCVGAILLDSGFNLNKVWKVMTSFLEPIMKFSSTLQLSPIRDLQELCQSHNLDLEFQTTKLTKMFSVEAKVTRNDICRTASATGQNIKEASKIASQKLFSYLKVKQICSVCFPPSSFSQHLKICFSLLHGDITGEYVKKDNDYILKLFC